MSHGMLQMMVKCVALEVAYMGIRVNAVAAGVTESITRTKDTTGGKHLTLEENVDFMAKAARDVPLKKVEKGETEGTNEWFTNIQLN